MSSRHLFARTIMGLEFGCIAAVLWFGARILPFETAAALPGPVPSAPAVLDPDAPPAPVEAAAASISESSAVPEVLWIDDSAGGHSARSRIGPSPDRDLAAEPVSLEHRRERDYYRAFRALAAHGTADVEAAARSAVAGRGPDCEKVAALRAVSDAHCPGAFDLLADAVMTLPDVCGPQADSVPRFALRALVDQAANEVRARQALERIAWNRDVSSELRRIAAAGVAAVADEVGAWRIVSRLEIEQDDRVREGAAQALARNSAAGSAARTAVQWIPSSPADGDAGDQQP